MMSLQYIVNRVMGKYLPPEQPQTGRTCAKCHATIGKHDRYHIRVTEHVSCEHPQGVPLPDSLARHIEEGI